MEGSGYSGDTNFNFTTFIPFTTPDIGIPSPSNIDDYENCRVWTPPRVFLQIFLIAVLICNMFACYVIITTTNKKGNSFVTHCMLLINFSGLALTLLLLLYPFSFKWTNMQREEITSTTITYNNQIEDVPFFQPILSNIKIKAVPPKPVHTCRQAGTLPCRTSGLMFGIFIYTPLVATAVMLIDFVMAALNWKMYRFRPHTASAIRLTLLISNLFAVTSVSALPAFGLGAHFHFYKLLKLCWLSDAFEVGKVQGFTFFIYGYTGSLTLVIACCTFLILKASMAKTMPYHGMTGSCSIMCGNIIMKSRSWKSYSRLVICVGFVTVITYLPITFGNVVRFSMFRYYDYYWFELTSQLLTLVLPTVNPFLYILLFEPHRQRSDEILGSWKGGQKMRGSSTNSSVSSFGEEDNFRREAWVENPNYHKHLRQNDKDLHGNFYPPDDDREPYYTKSVHRINPLYDDENYSYHPKIYHPEYYENYNRSRAPVIDTMGQYSFKDLMLKQAKKLTPHNLRRSENKENPDSAYSTFKNKKETSGVRSQKRSVSFVESVPQRTNRNAGNPSNQSTSYYDNGRQNRLEYPRHTPSDYDDHNRLRNQHRESDRVYNRPYKTSENLRNFDRNSGHQSRENRRSIPEAYRNELYNNIAEIMHRQNEQNRHRNEYKN